MRFLLKLMPVCLLAIPTVASADHMNGRYYGIGPLAGYRLDLQQSGRSIYGEIFECDEMAVIVQGQTDGGDYGFGQANDVRDGNWGSFELRWAPQGMIVDTLLGGQPYSGRFGHVEQTGACDTGGDDADDAAWGQQEEEEEDWGTQEEEEQDWGEQEEDPVEPDGGEADVAAQPQGGVQDGGEADMGAQPQGGGQQIEQEGGPLPNF